MTMKWNPELGLSVLKPMARREIWVQLWIKQYEAGHWDPDWEPKTAPVAGKRRAPRGPRPTEQQLDAAIAVHSTTMGGGFHNSLAVSGPLFADAIAGFEGIGLHTAAKLLRQAMADLPSGLAVDHDERAILINSLSDAKAARLEALGDSYQDLFPSDDILFAAIDEVTAAEPKAKG
jgi:hypothetical protein